MTAATCVRPAPGPGDEAADTLALRPGRVQLRRATADPALRYYTWVHPTPRPGAPWLVAVHGISRDPREQIRLLQPAASAAGVSLVAPRFDAGRFPGYQRLGLNGAGARSDQALLAILDDLRAVGGAGPHIDLFGFSGGAQFAHRFALLHPHVVRRLVLAAAGWYTLPDPARPYPHGVASPAGTPLPGFRPDSFLRIPQLVLVGANDRERDGALRTGRRVDREQGRHRLERAIRWTRHLQDLARRHGGDAGRFRLRVLPRTGHSFAEAVRNGGLDRHLIRFLQEQE
jgi:pimeloyl-ACP methyl ester carboxylesterase